MVSVKETLIVMWIEPDLYIRYTYGSMLLYEIGALKIRMLSSITSYMRSRAITTVIISRWSFMAYAFTSSAKS